MVEIYYPRARKTDVEPPAIELAKKIFAHHDEVTTQM